MTYEQFKNIYASVLERYYELGNRCDLTEDEQEEFEAIMDTAIWAFEYGDEHFNTEEITRVFECGCK